jgi:hypothetical protein
MSNIDEVLDVKGFWRKRTSLQFLIKWSDEAAPQWYTWDSTFLHNSTIHQFLLKKGGHWKNIIPKNYRDDYAERAAEAIRTAEVAEAQQPPANAH